MAVLFIAKLSLFLAAIGDKCTVPKAKSFFFIPTWWEYITGGERDAFNQCIPHVTFPDGAWAIGLAVLDILLRLAGFIAVVMIIVAGVEYITSIGNPEKITSARKRIQNSLIGLAAALVATAFVSFIGRQIG